MEGRGAGLLRTGLSRAVHFCGMQMQTRDDALTRAIPVLAFPLRELVAAHVSDADRNGAGARNSYLASYRFPERRVACP
jgi:hypothetical protein